MTEAFGLARAPFSRDLEPDALFASDGFKEGLARLLHTAEHRRLMLLTGEVGTGKSTLLRALAGRLDATRFEVIYLADPHMTPRSFYQQLLEALRVETPHMLAKARRLAHATLLERFRHERTPVLLIDEGQALSLPLLETIRGLSNYEFDSLSPFALVLAGGPELARRLRLVTLEALAQRIDLRYHLRAFQPHESAAYVRHHLQVAGATQELFTDEALHRLHQLTGGIPRRLGHAAATCLLAAAHNGRTLIDDGWVEQLTPEFQGTDPDRRDPPWPALYDTTSAGRR